MIFHLRQNVRVTVDKYVGHYTVFSTQKIIPLFFSLLLYFFKKKKKKKKLAVYLDSRENHEGKKINIFSIKDFFCMPGLGIFIQLDI